MKRRIYKTELHCHTTEMSGCASETAKGMIEKYVACGYTTVVLTNHCENSRIHAPQEYRYRYDSYEELINKIYDAIEYTRGLAEGKLHIIDGFELCNCVTENDYLIYGLTREEALAFDLCFSDIEDVADYVRGCGGVIIQAHPFRIGMTIIDPDLVDGYEVYNTHNKHPYMNAVARQWICNLGLEDKILTAGNDHHDPKDIPSAGILTSEPITTSEELVRALKSRDFSIFHEG